MLAYEVCQDASICSCVRTMWLWGDVLVQHQGRFAGLCCCLKQQGNRQDEDGQSEAMQCVCGGVDGVGGAAKVENTVIPETTLPPLSPPPIPLLGRSMANRGRKGNAV